ncbi:MAG: phosphoenolpyruvate carboxylase, partial [Alcanivoracaceae bacterium]
MNDDVHAPLREDVRKLGEILGQVLRQQGGDVFETVERIRQVAVEARATGAVDMSRLAALLRELDDDGLLSVARAFSQFLNLANIAEQHHRERLWR